MNPNSNFAPAYYPTVTPASTQLGTPSTCVPFSFLCNPFAGFTSGDIFNVNGGAVLPG